MKSQIPQLSLDQTKGTRTFHLPMDREYFTPRATLIVRRAPGYDHGVFQLGLSVCSQNDTFIKARGRRIAFFRMLGNQALIGTPAEIRAQLIEKLEYLNANRPGTVNGMIFANLDEIFDGLVDRFEKMEAGPKPKVSCSLPNPCVDFKL